MTSGFTRAPVLTPSALGTYWAAAPPSDDILGTIAEVRGALVGPGDVAVRLGGDEFVLVTGGLAGQGVDETAESIGAEIVLALAGRSAWGPPTGVPWTLPVACCRDADLSMSERKRRRHECTATPSRSDLQVLPSG